MMWLRTNDRSTAVFGIEKNLSTGQIVVTMHGRGAFELRKSRFY